ncbi:hypothetical protein DER46DRAFT_600284 [Fusarium sp. MPI-SDFR-AT-0072]|uniref:Uncharacterized protein n=1 Tax=Fusarium oxysporum f. sp. rapae TaxID=485398 RepID=A0A8J5NTM0_FUSOX|nr:hypothetical protein Forpe1208_v008359 [Fusarium oxysporum f. sp. rapae]KAH7169444.1 hypothetical protein DER46DRAFT_600284 [Fusarium sp. MPI-SDFR-AT-0072]KAI7761021.1 hypothetical protein LZL87_013963 [Fusarium oxysporum]
MGQRKLVFPPVPFSVEDVKLGTLISDLRNPHQDPGAILSTDPDTDWTVRTLLDVESSLGRDKTSSFWAQVTRLFRLSVDEAEKENLVVNAKASKVYELKRPKEILRNTWANDEAAKSLLRDSVKHERDSYLIVGLRTFIDASLTRGDQESKKKALDVKAPVGEALRAQAGVDVGDALDVGGGADKARSTSRNEVYRFDGEMVFAIAYRKVILGKISEDKTPDLQADNVWRMYDDVRGGDGSYEDYLIDLEDTDVALPDASGVKAEDATMDSDEDEEVVTFSDRFEAGNEEYFVI